MPMSDVSHKKKKIRRRRIPICSHRQRIMQMETWASSLMASYLHLVAGRFRVRAHEAAFDFFLWEKGQSNLGKKEGTDSL